MKPESKRVAKAIGAAVAGAAAGYVAGVLTAPAKGADTRRRIGRKIESEAEDIAYKAKTGLKDARTKVTKALGR